MWPGDFPHRCTCRCRPPPPRGSYSQKNWVGVCCPLIKTLTLYLWPQSAIFPTLFMTWPKIRNPIYDLNLTSKSCFRPALLLDLEFKPILNYRNIIREELLLIFVSIMMTKKWLLGLNSYPYQGKSTKTIYPNYDQNAQNHLKSIPYLRPKRLKNHTL